MAGFEKIGTEFLVNTTTASDQYSHNGITTLSDGRFVIAWEDSGPTGDGSVRAQIFNADGTKSAGEFLVNTTTKGDQYGPRSTPLSDGRFVITWTDGSVSGGDTSSWAVRGQIFSADGSKSGGEFLVNTTTKGEQETDGLITLSDGRFLATWTDESETGGDKSDSAVRAQIFNANGSKSGGEFLLNTTTAASQWGSRPTALADGGFVVTWTSGNSSIGGNDAVFVQIFNANGTKRGGEFRVDPAETQHHEQGRVTGLADGRFVVIWTDFTATGQDNSPTSVRGQMFNADGTRSGGEFLVNTTTPDEQSWSGVTTLADGRFVVAWTDWSMTGGDTSQAAIRGQVFAADGTKSGGEFLVNTTTASSQRVPSLTALDDGRFVVTWNDSSQTGGDTSGGALRAQIFDPTSYVGDDTAETVIGGSMDDTFAGGGGGDRLYGLGGDDRLDGGGDADVLEGGGGNDVFIVDNAGDAVIEAAGQGVDTVFASVDYVLKAGVEVELLRTSSDAGTAAINLAGNALKQTIVGNAGSNVLTDGGGAADTLQGLAGNDIYMVGSGGTAIVEAAGGGTDSVRSSVSYALKAGIEVEQLRTDNNAGTTAIDLAGNALKQTIVGNAGVNLLSDGGGAGADTLQGLGGNDTYVVGNGATAIVEAAGGGSDTVAATVDYVLKAGVEVELLRTNANGGTAAIDLTGNEFAQAVRGNAGSNILDGKAGNDILQGLGGKDFFLFSSALGATNVDVIADFAAVDDTVQLENAIFGKLSATGVLNTAFFRANSAGTAGDGNDYVLYDTTDGTLYYDADGNGAGQRVQFATLTGAPAISAADFVVI